MPDHQAPATHPMSYQQVISACAVGEWLRHKNPDNAVRQILKLAEKLGLPDNIPLVPRLRALAKGNVLAFTRKS